MAIELDLFNDYLPGIESAPPEEVPSPAIESEIEVDIDATQTVPIGEEEATPVEEAEACSTVLFPELEPLYTPPDPPPYPRELIVEEAFTYFRTKGFPYRSLPMHVARQEINRLAQMPTEALRCHTVAYQVMDTYHPHRWHGGVDGKSSPFESFNCDEKLRYALDWDLKSGVAVGGGFFRALNVVRGTQACANFRPAFALLIYRRYAPKDAVILDTSTGYGGRLVGFLASQCAEYIGIDPSSQTSEGNRRLAADLGAHKRITLLESPVEDLDVTPYRERCDFAFTSPPYFCKERYADEPTQSWLRYPTADAWREGFLRAMLRFQFAALKPASWNVVNIGNVTVRGKLIPLVEWTLALAQEEGFQCEGCGESLPLTKRIGAHQDEELATEPVLLFKKPNI